MTGLRYTPKVCAERLGLEPRQHLRADRLAICSVTTPAPLQQQTPWSEAATKLRHSVAQTRIFDYLVALKTYLPKHQRFAL